MKFTFRNLARTVRSLGFVAATAMFSVSANAQAINEGFTNIATLFTSGWAQQNLSTPIGTNPNWVQGNATVFVANSSPDSSYVAANFNSVTGTNTISNWLFTPNRTFNNGDVISFFTRTAGTYADNLQVRFSSNGASVNAGTTNTSVGDFTQLLLEINPTLVVANYPTTWTQYTVTISGLAAPTSGRIAFRYFVTGGGPTGANSNYIGIDNYVYTPAGAGAAEVGITSVNPGQYTLIPQSQVSSFPVSAVVSNTGTATAAAINLTTRVFKLPNTTTPVYTGTGSTTNLGTGANATINAATAFTPAAPVLGDYIFESVISGNTGATTANDTFRYGVSVVPNWYARDNGTSAQGVGAPNTISAIIGNTYNVTANSVMDSVLFFCYPGAAGLGDTVRVRIATTVAGVPSNTVYVGQSAIYRFTVADTGARVITIPVTNLTGGALTLTPGTYLVGLEKFLTSDNYGLQCATSLYTPNTVYANINNGTYSPLSSLIPGFTFTPIIRAFLRSSCAVTASMASTNATCTGGTGTATVTAAAGTAPYTYLWSNTTTNATASNLVAGNYSVTVTDASGCVASNTVTVGSTTTTITTTTPTTTNSACGGATGSASVNPSNGTAPYNYIWSNGRTTQSNTGIAAGSYTVTITDANGCNGVISGIVVNNPNAPTASIGSSQNVACNGGNTGNATATGTGGTAPYTFNWSNSTTGATANNLTAGTYTVTVTDAASCANVTSVTITQPTALVVTNNATATANVSCFNGNNGSAGVTATGGTTGALGYTYVWSNAGNTATITGLTAGTYTVTVTDANGCNNTSSITITQPATALGVSAAGTDITCNGSANGTGTATATGGTAPYSYTWSNGTNGGSASNLATGTYTVTATDANGCVANASAITITEPTAINSSTTVTDCSAFGATDGDVALAAGGGTGAYTYLWSNGATTANLANVAAGTYSVTITDANGCTDVATAIVDQPSSVGVTNANINISVFPNPAEASAILTISLVNSSDVNIQITNVTGQVIRTISDASVINNQYTLNTSEWAAGVYFVRVAAGNDVATYRLTKK